MSHFNRTPSGSKRRYGSTNEDPPGAYSIPFSRQLHTSQSPEDSQSPQSSQESRLPKAFERHSIQAQPPFESTLAYIPASIHASTVIPLPPFSSTTGSPMFTLPPLSLSTRTSISTTPPFEKLSREPTTNEPILQNLQRENADLVAAYAHSKIHIADLDKTVQSSSLELNKLFQERQSLKAKVDVLEAEIEELQNSIEHSQRHSVAKDTQYSQIVEMSSRLQIQATADTQQRTFEKNQWVKERGDMQQTIITLRSEVRSLRKIYSGLSAPLHHRSGTSSKDTFRDDFTVSSPVALQAELRDMQQTNSNLEDALEKVRQEHTQLVLHVERLGGISRNMQTHLRDAGADGLNSQGPNGAGPWEDRER